MKLLLDLPLQTTDERLYLLAGKILLYFAENREVESLKGIHTSFYPFNCIVKRSSSFDLNLFVSLQSCEEMLNYDGILDSLGHYARSRDSVLQKVVIKMIFCVMDLKELRYK